jgi:hypothetical protein
MGNSGYMPHLVQSTLGGVIRQVLNSFRRVFGCFRREGPEVPDVTYHRVVETSALVFKKSQRARKQT